MAALSILILLVSIVGWMNLIGWEFGLVEVLTAFMVNGFAIDLVIRLTMEYNLAPYYSRNDKMKFAFDTLGVPVFTSTLLTLGTCLPLLFCELVFLQKCSLVVLSMLSASFAIGYLFFSAAMHIIGP